MNKEDLMVPNLIKQAQFSPNQSRSNSTNLGPRIVAGAWSNQNRLKGSGEKLVCKLKFFLIQMQRQIQICACLLCLCVDWSIVLCQDLYVVETE